MSEIERYVEYAGEHDGKHLFVTPSWTGGEETYEILVTPGSWMVRCNCFGSNRHRLYADLLHPDKSHGCKHANRVAQIVKDHLQKARDQPPQE